MNIYWYDISDAKDGSNIVSIHKAELKDGTCEVFAVPQHEFANCVWQAAFKKPFRLINNATRSEALAYLNDVGKLPAIEVQLVIAGDDVISESIAMIPAVSDIAV